jgi:fermentation-respiration switch protein FrsA (DUF1100 family)
MQQKIRFYSQGLGLAGHLYFPDHFSPAQQYPAIIVGGSWTTVKEQMSGLYAERLSRHGFITLAFDPRYFGESEGEPRYWESPEAKIADYESAVSFLQTVRGVDRDKIFLTAVCAGAGYMAALAARSAQVKGVAIIAGWLHDAESVRLIYGGEEGVRERLENAEQARKLFKEQGEVKYIPAISTTDPSAAMFGDYDYYLNPLRGGIPQWSAEKFAVISWQDWLTFDPMPYAAAIRQPVLMVHSDGAVLAGNAKRFFAHIPHSQKVLYWTNGNQFDFYDNPLQVNEAVAAITIFFKSLHALTT